MYPSDLHELQDIIRQHPRLLPRGGGSKPALSTPPDGALSLDMGGLRGMLAYQPEEFTFTALPGTPIKDVVRSLAEHHQYLPFDPPLAERGATLGGTVAAGLSGPGRYRFGGVRDFILGIQFIDGHGELIRGGGTVVKNAAGFDLPKFMVGSLGKFGALTELTFKVFPSPAQYATYRADYALPEDALAALIRLSRAPLDLAALDLVVEGERWAVLVRQAGMENAIPGKLARLANLSQEAEGFLHGQVYEHGVTEEALWVAGREFSWVPAEYSLAKIALTPGRLLELDKGLAQVGALRRYSAGANLGWVAWPGSPGELDSLLSQIGLSGLLLTGAWPQARLGMRRGASFEGRAKQALDPAGRWGEV